MTSSWCPWSIPLYEGFRNGPRSLRVSSFRFPPLKCPSTGHSSDWVRNPVNCSFTFWIPAACHNFLSFCLCFNKKSKPGRSLFRSESVTLLVDNPYAGAIEAAKSRAALSASFPDLISILGDTESETRLWNRSQSVNFSTWPERCLLLTWSSMWNVIGRWSETGYQKQIFWWTTMSRKQITERVYGYGKRTVGMRASRKPIRARTIMRNSVILEEATFHSRYKGVNLKSHIRNRRLRETFQLIFLQNIFELSVTALTCQLLLIILTSTLNFVK
jgi:hypothetical protein